MPNPRFLPLVLGCLLTAAFCSASAHAQEKSSGRPTPRYAPLDLEGDPQQMLDEQRRRLRLLQLQQEWAPLLNDLSKVDPEKLKEKLKKDFESFKDIAPKILGKAEADALVKMLEDPKKDWSVEEKQKMAAAAKKLMEQVHKARSGESPTAPPDDPGRSSTEPNPANPERAPGLEERMMRWLRDRMHDADRSRLGGMLRESPAWTQALADLDNILDGREPSSGPLSEWAKDMLPDPGHLLENWEPSELPLPALPDVDWSLGGGGMPSGLASADWLWNTLEAILWAALVIGGGFAAWLFWARLRSRANADTLAWTPGPWPVDPARLADAAQVIRGFEHLALLRLGLPARACNHRRLAQKLAAPAQAAHRAAALELARLYEQARYAPNAPLSPAALDTARRGLCLLAGMPCS